MGNLFSKSEAKKIKKQLQTVLNGHLEDTVKKHVEDEAKKLTNLMLNKVQKRLNENNDDVNDANLNDQQLQSTSINANVNQPQQASDKVDDMLQSIKPFIDDFQSKKNKQEQKQSLVLLSQHINANINNLGN